jgi:hypothetical protein
MEALGEKVKDEDPKGEMDQYRGVEPRPSAKDRGRLIIGAGGDLFWERRRQEFIVAIGGGRGTPYR